MIVINELIKNVQNGTMTAEQAATEVHPYAAEYYSPAPGEWDAYQAIRTAFKHTQAVPVVAAAVEIPMIKCSCGHSVPQGLVMSASMGNSCPDCYDRMSN